MLMTLNVINAIVIKEFAEARVEVNHVLDMKNVMWDLLVDMLWNGLIQHIVENSYQLEKNAWKMLTVHSITIVGILVNNMQRILPSNVWKHMLWQMESSLVGMHPITILCNMKTTELMAKSVNLCLLFKSIVTLLNVPHMSKQLSHSFIIL